MDLIRYNSELTLHMSGLTNHGVQCHFNSMIQGFLSCTSIITVFKTNEDGIQTRNALCKILWQMIQQSLANSSISAFGPMLWSAFMLKTAASRKRYGDSQEDAHESFVRFLDALDAPELEYLFEHSYKQTIVCGHCDHRHRSSNQDVNTFIEIHPHELAADITNLQTMILNQNPPTDDNWKCVNTECGKLGNKRMFKRLSTAPEILVVMFKKFEKKNLIVCPETIVIPSFDPKVPYQYRLVALNEHGGDQSGGHYWARALRREGQAFLNDDTARAETGNLTATKDTYLVWYHII